MIAIRRQEQDETRITVLADCGAAPAHITYAQSSSQHRKTAIGLNTATVVEGREHRPNNSRPHQGITTSTYVHVDTDEDATNAERLSSTITTLNATTAAIGTHDEIRAGNQCQLTSTDRCNYHDMYITEPFRTELRETCDVNENGLQLIMVTGTAATTSCDYRKHEGRNVLRTAPQRRVSKAPGHDYDFSAEAFSKATLLLPVSLRNAPPQTKEREVKAFSNPRPITVTASTEIRTGKARSSHGPPMAPSNAAVAPDAAASTGTGTLLRLPLEGDQHDELMSRVVLRPVFVFSAMCARRLWRPMAIVRRPPTTTIDGRRQRRAHTTKSPMKGATDSQHVVGEDVSGVTPSACGHSSWRQPIAACGGKQYVSGVACLPYARTQHVHTTSSSSLTGAQCWPPGRAIRIRSLLRVRPLPRGNPAQNMFLVTQ